MAIKPQFLLYLVISYAILLMLLLSVPAQADCPDTSIKCNTFTYGWQGKCFKTLSCKPCGKKHCPNRPTLGNQPSVAILDDARGKQCRDKIQNIKLKDGAKENSVCSVPGFLPEHLKNFLGMAHHIFGQGACMEHDICYSTPGMNQKLCDDMFYDNMVRSCNQYYFGHLKKSNRAIRAQNLPGYEYCIGVAKSFWQAVHVKGASSFGAKGGGKTCQGITAPPRLKTHVYVDGSSIIRLISTKGKSNKPGKIKVCLQNNTKRWKGLHFKREKEAKYKAPKKGSQSCGHYQPGKKTFYFYKSGLAKLTKTNGITGSYEIDLSGYAGYEVRFIWDK